MFLTTPKNPQKVPKYYKKPYPLCQPPSTWLIHFLEININNITNFCYPPAGTPLPLSCLSPFLDKMPLF